MLFIDEIHRMARPAEEMLYLAMEDFRVDVVVGKGPGATAIPLEIAAVHPGRRHHQGRAAARRRCATGSASPRTWTSTTPAELEQVLDRSARLLGVTLRRRRRARDRRPLPGHAAHRQPAAAPGARLRRGARRRRGQPRTSPRRRWSSTRSTTWGSTGSTGRCSRRCCASSAAARSGCPRWPSRWGRSRRPSRRWPSRSWCAQGLLARTPRGRVATAAAWAHLGMTPPPDAFGAALFD